MIRVGDAGVVLSCNVINNVRFAAVAENGMNIN